MTPQQIKDQWSANGKEASTAGTKMHYDIECFYNECPNENDSTEYKWFLDFEKTRTQEGGFGQFLTPYRTEMMVYHEELRLSGSIDMIYEAPDGTLQIYDWKRCKQIKKDNPWDCATRECINHLPDSNYWHYSLQLNTYKAILEQKYGKKVTDLFLVCLHPNNENKSYQRIRVPILTQEISDLFQHRLQQVASVSIPDEPSTPSEPYFVYTDGACSKNGAKNAVAGYGIYFGPGDTRNTSKRLSGKQTNNCAELTAVIETYPLIEKDVLNGTDITIMTDSEYVIKCVTTYGEKMKKKDYKTKGEPIPNADLVKKAYELYCKHQNVSFRYIKAHTDANDIHSKGNSEADRLAVEGCTQTNSSISPILLANIASSIKQPKINTTTKAKRNLKCKIYLKVPYSEKDKAKEKGARWDPSKKKWYIYHTNPYKDELIETYIS